MKKLNKSLISTSIAIALLSGCGSSGSDSNTDTIADTPDVDTATKTITIIDGYLENVSVYADRNNNQIAEADELLAGKTNAKGEIEVSLADAEFDLIAQIIGYETKDSDDEGTTGRDYQMIAKAGQNYITPFTTIAKVQNKTLAEVATVLNIDESIIMGDYVALKDESASKEGAKQAHAYARNLTTSLSDKVTGNTGKELTEFIDTIKENIEEAINEGKDLDSLITDVVKLENILVAGNTFYSLAINADTDEKEGFSTFKYLADNKYTFSNGKGDFSGTYSVKDNEALYDGELFDPTVFISKTNYINITSNGTLDIVSLTKDEQPISSDTFAGTTWYQLFDDGGYTHYTTKPCLMKVEFTTTTEMKYISSDNCDLSTSDSEVEEYSYQWKVEDNKLVIFDNEDGVEGGEAQFSFTSKSERLMLAENQYNDRKSLFLADEEIAERIHSEWNK